MSRRFGSLRARRAERASRGFETDPGVVERETESVLISELQESDTPADVIHDVAEDVEEANAAADGSTSGSRWFHRTPSRSTLGIGGVVLLALAVLASRARGRRRM